MKIIPRLEVGTRSYDGEFKLTYPGGRSVRSGVTMGSKFVRPGVTLARGPLYADLYYQTIGKDSDKLGGEVSDAESYVGSRDEYVLGVGYSLTPNLTAIAGLRYSAAALDGEDGGHVTIDSRAYFIGGAYSVPIKSFGVLSASAAYMLIDDVDTSVRARDPISSSFVVDHGSGDGEGWKLGAAWTGRLTRSVNYTVGVDYYHYDWVTKGQTALNTREDELAMRVGISLAF